MIAGKNARIDSTRGDPASAPGPDALRGHTPGGGSLPCSDAGSTGGTYFLGRYRVVDEIGVGGMATVHLARIDGPGGFQKWVAIKRIHPHLVEDESFVDMFLDEARIAARISHPNVAGVFELGKHSDTYWIAMEYMHGEPLREVMRRAEEMGQAMPPEVACHVIVDAAEGLHSAHELLGRNGEKLNLVHRDVTPHNIFVTYEGCTKVVDFGIAKFDSRIANTRDGTLKGKLAYMSPEQAAGEPIDRRSDIFSLGVVLWELTTGHRLFRMDNDLDTLVKARECCVPRPSSIVPGYPLDLERIVLKALAKTKSERFGTARQLSHALQVLLMRRGLFFANDDVAAHMSALFGDRIQKREDHLRWAAEVTHTVDFDELGTVAPSQWHDSYESLVVLESDTLDSQSIASRTSPRPAAGAPVPGYRPSSPHAPANATEAADRRPTIRPGNRNTGAAPRTVPPPLPPIRSARQSGRYEMVTVPERPSPSTNDEISDDFIEVGDSAINDSPSQPRAPDSNTTLTRGATPSAMMAHAALHPAPRRTRTLPPVPPVMVRQTVRPSPSPVPPPAKPRPPAIPVKVSTTMIPPPMRTATPGTSASLVPPPRRPTTPARAPFVAPPVLPLRSRIDLRDYRKTPARKGQRRAPVTLIAAVSALVGAAVFGLAVLLLSPERAGTPWEPPPHANGQSPDPFHSAQAQFVAILAPSPPATSDGIVSHAPSPPRPAQMAQPSTASVVTTTNVNALPVAAAPDPDEKASQTVPTKARRVWRWGTRR